MHRLRFFFVLLVFAGALTSSAQSASSACGTPLLFASDTQRPMRIERLWLKSHHNEEATAALFQELLRQPPTDLFILGDVVNLACKENRWPLVDTFLHKARNEGFAVHGLLGNHEVMRNAEKGERNFQQRFVDHVRTGYMVQQDSIAVILLNSNFAELTTAERASQQARYTAMLVELDTLAAVRTVIVCCHHSPYSDSKLVGSNTDVQDAFVAPFMRCNKALLFISGHAHIFQHFGQGGRHFLVIGGGGGLHHPLRKEKVSVQNLDPEYSPLFHYLSVQRCGGRLVVTSNQLTEDRTGFSLGRSFAISLP